MGKLAALIIFYLWAEEILYLCMFGHNNLYYHRTWVELMFWSPFQVKKGEKDMTFSIEVKQKWNFSIRSKNGIFHVLFVNVTSYMHYK